MKRTVVVVDGMGGGIGAQLVSRIQEQAGDLVEVVALGTNSSATDRMLKAGADRGASGENAVKVSVRLGAFILGPIGIVVPHGLMGEITPAMAEAILGAPGERLLVPVAQGHFTLVGVTLAPTGRLVAAAVDELLARLKSASSSA